MSKDISNLELPLQKVIDLGQLDHWLRELLPLMPRTSDGDRISQERDIHTAALEMARPDFNRHIFTYRTLDLKDAGIERGDILALVGLRKLLKACQHANIRIDVRLLERGALEVAFDPEEPFSRSLILGASHDNVIIVMFGKI